MTSREALAQAGWTTSAIGAQLRAGRWQAAGRSIILHNGELTPAEYRSACLTSLGRRALLTAFTALELRGLQGWSRPAIHILVPGGTHVADRRLPGVIVHFASRWGGVERRASNGVDSVAGAAVLAAACFDQARPAVGLLAATVQQRLTDVASVVRAVAEAPRTRHRAVLLSCLADIDGGSQALSEIDFVRLCRRHALPLPRRQAVRVEPSGRRRYLDAEWIRSDGRRVVAEVDGALHRRSDQWWADLDRQNELVLAHDLVLRFPTVVVRTAGDRVAAQLRRALLLT